jgi:hypothetical protein
MRCYLLSLAELLMEAPKWIANSPNERAAWYVREARRRFLLLLHMRPYAARPRSRRDKVVPLHRVD